MAAERSIEIRLNTMVMSISEDKTITCVSRGRGLERVTAGAIILAMGCRERPRGAIGIPGSRPAGIMTAGTAQRFVNLEGYMPGREIVILGSGDIGLIMARRMTLQGAKVKACVELMPYSSGLKRNIVQCLDDYGIPLMLSHTVVDIKGQKRLESVTIAEVDSNSRPIPGTEQEIACDTLLLSVGLIPENELSLMAGVEMSTATNGAAVDQDLSTGVEGIFSCGNVLHVHDLVDNVSEESERAGRAAARYIADRDAFVGGQSECIPVIDGEGVRGCVPQRISTGAGAAGPVTIMFRPSRVFGKSAIIVASGGEQLARAVKPVMAPGEMASVKLDAGALAKCSGSITVSIQEL